MTTTMLDHRPTNMPHAADHVGLPPPHAMDLFDRDRVVGWIAGHDVGFHGFADAEETMHAAWVAHRTLSQRLARSRGERPVPIDVAPLSVSRDGDGEQILASGDAIARMLRPGAAERDGLDTFAFAIRVPETEDELTVRAVAYLIYRTLRKSGVRWMMWRRAAAAPAPIESRATDAQPTTSGDERAARERRQWRDPGSATRFGRIVRALGLSGRPMTREADTS